MLLCAGFATVPLSADRLALGTLTVVANTRSSSARRPSVGGLAAGLTIGRATSGPAVAGASGTTTPKRPFDATPKLPAFSRGTPPDVAAALSRHAHSGVPTPGPFAGDPNVKAAPMRTGSPTGVPAAGSSAQHPAAQPSDRSRDRIKQLYATAGR